MKLQQLFESTGTTIPPLADILLDTVSYRDTSINKKFEQALQYLAKKNGVPYQQYEAYVLLADLEPASRFVNTYPAFFTRLNSLHLQDDDEIEEQIEQLVDEYVDYIRELQHHLSDLTNSDWFGKKIRYPILRRNLKQN